MKHFILIFSLSLMACQKQKNTTTGNPLVSLSMSSSQSTLAVAFLSFKHFLKSMLFPKAVASQPPVTTDAAGNSVLLDQGWMVVKEIEFESTETPNTDETDGDDVQFLGPYVVDLFSATPDLLGTQSISTNSIRRIKMKLHRLEVAFDNSPTEVLGNSLFFHGTIDGKAFSIISEEGTEFQVSGPKALNVYDNMNLLLSFKISPIISKIDLTSIKSQTDPVIISDSNKLSGGANICPTIDTSLTTIYDCFRKAIEQQANLGDDSDNSGEIEPDENSVNE